MLTRRQRKLLAQPDKPESYDIEELSDSTRELVEKELKFKQIQLDPIKKNILNSKGISFQHHLKENLKEVTDVYEYLNVSQKHMCFNFDSLRFRRLTEQERKEYKRINHKWPEEKSKHKQSVLDFSPEQNRSRSQEVQRNIFMASS